MYKTLNGQTTVKLKKICLDEGLSGYSKMTKKELVTYVKIHLLHKMLNKNIAKLNSL